MGAGVWFVRTLQNTTLEDFVETHNCKLCVVFRSRVLLSVTECVS